VIKSKRIRLKRNVAHMDDVVKAHKIFIGRPEGKRPRGRPRSRWKENIRMGLPVIVWGDVDWMHLS
jgi:hypothetical protein